LRIQILDTVNNVTTVYLSIREAARSIGCVVPPVGTIRKAIKHLEESFHTYKEKRVIIENLQPLQINNSTYPTPL
jgi:hypothetical protein